MPQTSISHSTVDSERFGLRAARAFLHQADDFSRINAFFQSEQVDFLILRCDTNALDVVHFLEKKDFLLMDTLLYFSFPLLEDKLPPRVDETISPISPESQIALVKVAQDAFQGYRSHYHVDPRLDQTKVEEGYLDWAARSARKEIADEVLVARKGEKITGFLSLRKNDDTTVEGPLLAVSPHAQRQGVGRKLMKAAFHWAYQQGAAEFIISTQVTNLRSQNLWTSLGMKLSHSFYTFHKWFER